MFIPIPTFSFVEVPFFEWVIAYLIVGFMVSLALHKMGNAYRKPSERHKPTLFEIVAVALFFPLMLYIIITEDD